MNGTVTYENGWGCADSGLESPSARVRRAPVGLRGTRYVNHALVDRFWALVNKDSGSECWLWKGRPNPYYGIIACDDGRRHAAHRVSWELHHGRSVPDGQKVLHRCDTPLCVNPDHLFLGTQKDNIHDSIQKGRFRAWGQTKLTVAAVKAIRHRYAAGGITQRQLGRLYGVARTTVMQIVNRTTWAHVKVLFLLSCLN